MKRQEVDGGGGGGLIPSPAMRWLITKKLGLLELKEGVLDSRAIDFTFTMTAKQRSKMSPSPELAGVQARRNPVKP